MKNLCLCIFTLLLIPSYISAQNSINIRIGSNIREAKIYLPDFNNSTGTIPLIIAFHGYTDNPENIEHASNMHQACKDGYVVAYPKGSKNDNGYFGWNAGGKYEEWTNNADDIYFIDTLISLLVDKYNINEKKIFITGHSNGAMMAYKIAVHLSPRICAAACVSGPMLDTIQNPSSPVSIMHVHGDADMVVPHNGTEQYSFHIPSIDETFKKWIEWNQCSTVPSVLKYNKQVTALKWTGEAEVSLFLIHGLGHDWPNNKNSSWDASKFILDFCKEHINECE